MSKISGRPARLFTVFVFVALIVGLCLAAVLMNNVAVASTPAPECNLKTINGEEYLGCYDSRVGQTVYRRLPEYVASLGLIVRVSTGGEPVWSPPAGYKVVDVRVVRDDMLEVKLSYEPTSLFGPFGIENLSVRNLQLDRDGYIPPQPLNPPLP